MLQDAYAEHLQDRQRQRQEEAFLQDHFRQKMMHKLA